MPPLGDFDEMVSAYAMIIIPPIIWVMAMKVSYDSCLAACTADDIDT